MSAEKFDIGTTLEWPTPPTIVGNYTHVAPGIVGRLLAVDAGYPVIQFRYAGPDGKHRWSSPIVIVHGQPCKEYESFEEKTLNDALDAIRAEVASARAKWGPFNSAHEGFAVLNEEFDELRAHVWMNQKRRDLIAMKKEAVQVAAMAVRFMCEVCDEDRGRR